MFDVRSIESGELQDQDSDTMSVSARRKRSFQRQACLLSVMAAFSLGLALGAFVPIIGLSTGISDANQQALASVENLTDSFVTTLNSSSSSNSSRIHNSINNNSRTLQASKLNHPRPHLHFPTIDDIRQRNLEIDSTNPYSSVSFVTEDQKQEDLLNNTIYMVKSENEDPHDNVSSKIVKNLDPAHKKSSTIQSHSNTWKYDSKNPKVPIEKSSLTPGDESRHNSVEFVQPENVSQNDHNEDLNGIIVDDIFWGQTIEKNLPKGFIEDDINEWNTFVNKGSVVGLKQGCGRMQNRMLIFSDGRRACARYRQNTDQIQGELFSFYLGQLLNISNLVPSTASIIDANSDLWLSATQDISNAQWKLLRPVVLTKWVPDLEPAGIPTPFQPLERHLNKFDVRNITLGLDVPKPQRSLLDWLGAAAATSTTEPRPIRPPGAVLLDAEKLNRLVELAQWSDLILFDYLIANLDRVVNNLYNFQWNADIMAAPAHNLAKQSDSQLLVFLDNESGLLHGYRLLKKYEAYHGLLLDNLCIFRQTTIEALQQLKDDGPGIKLQQLFEHSTSDKVRDILPPLPEKSIKILTDRIDRVLGQVQKCRELFSSTS